MHDRHNAWARDDGNGADRGRTRLCGGFALDVDLSFGSLPIVGGTIVAAGGNFGIDSVELFIASGAAALLKKPEL